jgi:glutamine amidotransferase
MIAIIDYKAGNLTSVERAMKSLGLKCAITSDHKKILSAERVIFPGVGAAGAAMETILSQGLDKVINKVVAKGTPFLGICLGTQIIFDQSEENDAQCLKILPGTAKKFPDSDLKVPHMGWNSLAVVRPHPILMDIDPDAQFYFVHSYYPAPADKENIVALTFYGITFASIVGYKNIVATQFHPEKSGNAGLQILKNFSLWDGRL